METGLLLDDLPLAVIFVGSVAFIAAWWELGFRIAARRADGAPVGPEPHASEILGAVLGLIAFLLALTFDMAVNRYADRQDLAREEAETIRAAWMGAGYAEAPVQAELRAVLQSYVDVRRTSLSTQAEFVELNRRSLELHVAMAQLAERVGRGSAVTDVHASLVGQLQDIASLHHQRVALGVRSRTPQSVLGTLFAAMAIAMFAVGWSAGRSRVHRFGALAAFALGFSAVIVLIAELDRPRNRLIEENRLVMAELHDWMAAQSATR